MAIPIGLDGSAQRILNRRAPRPNLVRITPRIDEHYITIAQGIVHEAKHVAISCLSKWQYQRVQPAAQLWRTRRPALQL
tara:strand:- start:237 stop:473 length:237 start_codon:yes stop_codon:yes gene_type:complete